MKAETFKAHRISENVYWVGAVDWAIRNFHGYSTDRGTTYNAYLILAEKITLVDTVKAPFKEEMLSRISSVVDPSEISVIISNHSEMDHSGCLIDTIDLVQPERVYASVAGVKALSQHFHSDREITAVKDGDTVSLGDKNIVFTETRMLHWPDSMFSFLPEDNLLFSQDGFGMHLASFERFADEIEDSILEHEAAKYYANILLPYSGQVLKLFDKIAQSNLKPAIIAPDHGPVLRTEKDIEKILSLYTLWAEQKPTKKAVVVFDTMWHSTELMARALCEGFENKGITVRFMPLSVTDRSAVATELLDAGAFVIGSPTINNNIFPTVADIMVYLKGLKPKNLVGAAFGSYGWSGEAVGHLDTMLDDMHIEHAGESVKVRYVPDNEDLKKCYILGEQIAERLHNNIT